MYEKYWEMDLRETGHFRSKPHAPTEVPRSMQIVNLSFLRNLSQQALSRGNTNP